MLSSSVQAPAEEEKEKTQQRRSAPARFLERYEIGAVIGEGNFAKVRLARQVATGRPFAVKVLDNSRFSCRRNDDQIRREIATLKVLRHPNVVRLHEVSATKSKIYMVLEYVEGGDLFEKIEKKVRFSEKEGRRLFQQLIDAVSYCHDKGVYHRDLKPENVLVDKRGSIKITDFGLSALPQHLGNDGLLHTTCGSPNYIAPEVLQNRGYDGSLSDVWSCGVILYTMLVGYPPFEDRNMVVLYQKIFKGEVQFPSFVPEGAKKLLKRVLQPCPGKRITMAGIKENEWFKKGYKPAVPYQDDDDHVDMDAAANRRAAEHLEAEGKPAHFSAFQLIGMSSYLDLSGFFEQDACARKIMLSSNQSALELLGNMEALLKELDFQVLRKHRTMKIMQHNNSGPVSSRTPGSFLAVAEVFEINQELSVVELRRVHGDPSLYRTVCDGLSDGLSAQALQKAESIGSFSSSSGSESEGEGNAA